ncbi:MAG: prepilin-type N-terminal cleavage/methylation domain-containing protein [Patescibacteria group bacterium]|nr:prepilin-type N-terminal cleavage/methylation domain-containing protein [Patescibacteria group bacterium]
MIFTPSKRAGFTILELLVVIVFVGILAAVAIYSLNVTRATSRDSKRVSDVSVVRAALSQHWLQKASYPVSEGVNLGQVGANADVLAGNGFVAGDQAVDPLFLQRVPTGPKTGEYYVYRGAVSGYSIKFTTERVTAYGPAGTYYAHAGGVDTSDELK